MTADPRIESLLRPKSIAIVGASQAANRLAGQVIPMLEKGGYRGAIYPVNPRYETIGNHKCFPSLSAIPDRVDHCIVAVAKERVLDVLRECRDRNVGSAAIFSSGYAETGAEGASAQQELLDAAGGMVFIGPNCMGMVNLVDKVVAAPAPVFDKSEGHGDVALLSQSGGLAYATVAFFAAQQHIDFTYVVNTGNSAGIDFADLIDAMNRDAATKVIFVVAESEGVVGEVIGAVRRYGLVKPIVLLKLGRGATGARMALSHTGSLAGDYRLARDCAEQHGIVCCEDVDEALGATELLRRGFGPRNASGVAAISISGGNITLFADQADAEGVGFAELAPETQARLGEVLPSFISVRNPIDITALGYEQPDLHTRVFDVLITDPAVHTLIPIITTATDYTPVCNQLAALKARSDAPLITLWTGGSFETRSREILREAEIPVFRSAGVLARTLAAIGRAQPAAPAPSMVAQAVPELPAVEGALSESQSLAFLEAAGVSVPPWATCGQNDLEAACESVGYPVVIKTDSTETHISDSGAVILGIENPEDLKRARERIAPLGDRLLVARFLPGTELIVSTFAHPSFGMVMMAGSGGRMAELLRDVAFALLPASRETLKAMLERTLAGAALARGFRGAAGVDAAVEFLERLSRLAVASDGAVAQIELNPVTVGNHGAVAVDASVTPATKKREVKQS